MLRIVSLAFLLLVAAQLAQASADPRCVAAATAGGPTAVFRELGFSPDVAAAIERSGGRLRNRILRVHGEVANGTLPHSSLSEVQAVTVYRGLALDFAAGERYDPAFLSDSYDFKYVSDHLETALKYVVGDTHRRGLSDLVRANRGRFSNTTEAFPYFGLIVKMQVPAIAENDRGSSEVMRLFKSLVPNDAPFTEELGLVDVQYLMKHSMEDDFHLRDAILWISVAEARSRGLIR